ncbi:MAG TPA: AtpZ/AtpI family protein, partial [Candidatus Polarisedimenticolaceae bacterium]|nr:AtpZ/AtpI family protein [Candidatus Polarisedimenticolaceae bacterium]
LEYLCDYESGELKAGDDLVNAVWVDKNQLHTYELSPPSQNLYRALGWLAYRNGEGQVASPLDGFRVWALVGTVGWQAAGPLLILGFGGGLLDKQLHTSPLLLMTGCVVAIALSYVLVRGTVRRMQAEVDKRASKRESLKPND